MPSDRVIVAVLVTLFGVSLAVGYVIREARNYRNHHDARALRSLVAAFTVLFFTFALIGRSPTLRDAFALDWPVLFAFLTTSGLSAGLVGLGFLALTSARGRRAKP